MATNPLYPIGGRDGVWEGWGLTPNKPVLDDPVNTPTPTPTDDVDVGRTKFGKRVWYPEFSLYFDPTDNTWYTKEGTRASDPRQKTEPGRIDPIENPPGPPGPAPPWVPYTPPDDTPTGPTPDTPMGIPPGLNIWEIADYLRKGEQVQGGTSAPTVNMPDAPGFAPPNVEAPRGGYGNSTPMGAISGALRGFAPHGDVLSQFSAPRTYGGLARSTG